MSAAALHGFPSFHNVQELSSNRTCLYHIAGMVLEPIRMITDEVIGDSLLSATTALNSSKCWVEYRNHHRLNNRIRKSQRCSEISRCMNLR